MNEGKTSFGVTVMEVSPRDGLQNEELVFSPDQKLKLIKVIFKLKIKYFSKTLIILLILHGVLIQRT